MKLFKVRAILVAASLSIFLCLSTSVAEVSTPSENQIENILETFGNLEADSRKANFDMFYQRIKSFSDVEDLDLYLARILTMFNGDDNGKSNTEKAISLVEGYLKNNPNSYKGYVGLADAYQSKLSINAIFSDPSKWKDKDDIKLREKSLENLEKSFAINNSYGRAYRIKGELSEGEEKIKLLETAIRLNPADNDARRVLVWELNGKKRYDEAINEIAAWIQTNPSIDIAIEACVSLAKEYRNKKEYQKSIEIFEKALQLRSESGRDGLETIFSGVDSIYSELADTYVEAKNTKKAEYYYLEYLRLKPKAYYVRFNLAKLYHDTKQSDKAIVQYEQVLAYDADNTASIYNLALLSEESDPDKAKELYKKYIEMRINDESDHAKTWVENAKGRLRSLGVYTYPKSKKELNDEKSAWIKNSFGVGVALAVFGLIIFLAWKFKRATKWIILFITLATVVIISLNEAGGYDPQLGRAILYIIPTLITGGFLLYLFRKR